MFSQCFLNAFALLFQCFSLVSQYFSIFFFNAFSMLFNAFSILFSMLFIDIQSFFKAFSMVFHVLPERLARPPSHFDECLSYWRASVGTDTGGRGRGNRHRLARPPSHFDECLSFWRASVGTDTGEPVHVEPCAWRRAPA